MQSGHLTRAGFGSWLVPLVVLVGLVAVGGGPVSGAVASGGPVSDGIPPWETALAQSDIEPDTVSLRAVVGEDGSATWWVTYRVELDDENATTAFEDLQADIGAEPTPYLERFGDRMERTARAAENATGREMTVSNYSVNASRESLPQGEYGLVTYRLDWSRFAATEGGRIVVGDAIDQFFLDEHTSLTIAWPGGYSLSSVTPDATSLDDGSVTWQGRRDFGPGEPRVTVVQETTPDGGDGESGGRLPLVPLGAALAGVFIAVGGWLWIRRSRGDDPRESDGRTGSNGDQDPGGAAQRDASADEAKGPPPKLLSNEERVVALVKDRGGRLKQQQVAAELDWTDAKTSQVVSDLRDEGALESFRLGRENVLTLPDVSLEQYSDGLNDGDE